MKAQLRCLLVLGGLQMAALAAPGQPSPEYDFYRVRSGESVEAIASSRGLRADVLRQLNPQLEHVVFPEEGSVIFVPQRTEAPRRVLAARSGRLQPTLPGASAPPAHKAEPQVASSKEASSKEVSSAPARESASRASSGFGLSDEEVDTIFEQVVQPRRGAVAIEDSEPLELPTHQNYMITSDGRTIPVPCAPVRRKKVEKEKEESHSDKPLALSARGQKVVRIIKESFKYLGVPYVWGGEDPSGMDCSGFTQKVFTDRGMYMPRTADLQFEVGQVVPRGQEQPGDLVFFETYCPGASHVGIYMGRNQFVHASSGAGYITFGDLRDEYFSRCYLGARRNW